MGHYRSEMVSEEDDAREAQEKRERRQKRAAKIKEAIEADGIEFMLADILDDPTRASIRFG